MNDEFCQWLTDLFKGFTLSTFGLATANNQIRSLATEASFLAKVVEEELLNLIEAKCAARGWACNRGGERTYPDIEIQSNFDGKVAYRAVDVKCASINLKGRIQSRPTLYTFGTYLFDRQNTPQGILRPYSTYASHHDVLVLYNVNIDQKVRNLPISESGEATENLTSWWKEQARQLSPLRDVEVVVAEPWQIASYVVASGTRDYVGAMMRIDDLRQRRGCFRSKQAFEAFWGVIPPRKLSSVFDTIFRKVQVDDDYIQSSACRVEHLAEMLKRDTQEQIAIIDQDKGYPVVLRDHSTRLGAEIWKMPSMRPEWLIFPRIAIAYEKKLDLEDAQLNNVEKDLVKILKKPSIPRTVHALG